MRKILIFFSNLISLSSSDFRHINRWKYLGINSLFFTALLIPKLTYSQPALLQNVITRVEADVRKNAREGIFEKVVIDLNEDQINDYVYTYSCGESDCIEVYLNKNDKLIKILYEMQKNYGIWLINGRKMLRLEMNECCGESPFHSYRTYFFTSDKAILEENYVLTHKSYVIYTDELTPAVYHSKPYFVRVLKQDYNLRYAPKIEKVKKSNDDFQFTCEDRTNIITNNKINTRLKVLSEKIQQGKNWLFIEVSCADTHPDRSYDEFKPQNIRGWVSAKFVQRE